MMNERANTAHGPHIDLDAVISDGNKRIRRHRTVGGLAAAAAVAAVALVVPVAIHGVTDFDSSRGPQPASGGRYADRQVTYAIGTTIYYGDEAIDVSPHKVGAFVETDDGFVFTTPGDRVYFTNGQDTVDLGAAGAPYGTVLAADDSGSYVGWVDFSATAAPEFVVYDTAAGREVVRSADGNEPYTEDTGEFDLPAIHAIDGQTAYWHSSRGVVAYDLEIGRGQLIQPGASTQWLYDVANGQTARASFDDQTTAVSSDPASDGPYFDDAGWALLSPSARYVVTDPKDWSTVWNVASGRDVTPKAPGNGKLFVFAWLDDDTLVGGVFPHGDAARPLDLVTCSVSADKCEIADEQVGTLGALQLPVGEHFES